MPISPNRQTGDPSQFLTALSSAFFEWILILLLLIDAFCLFLVSKIFHSYKLQTPCLLCSRIGYLLGNEKLEFYRDLVCDAHKSEISSLAFCHVHKKLADACKMCETCLVSFAKITSEDYKFFMSKVSVGLNDDNQLLNSSSDEIASVSLLNKDYDVGSPIARPCSCCSRRLSHQKSIFKELTYPGTSLSNVRLLAHVQDGLIKVKDVLSMSLAEYKPGGHTFDCLSHFRYKELNTTSEPESEVPLSDDDYDGSYKPCETEVVREEFANQHLISEVEVLENLIHPDPLVSVASTSVSKSQFVEDGSYDKSFVESNADPGHGLKEVSWTHIEGKPNRPTSPQTISEPVSKRISNAKDLSEVDVSRTLSTSPVEIKECADLIDLTSEADKVMIESTHNLTSDHKEAQPPSTSEIILARESARLHENLKQRLSQIPSPRWLQSPRNDVIQGSRKDDDRKLFHTLSFNGFPSFNKKLDAELSYSEIAEGSIFSEVKDVSVESLKKQIEIDRKTLNILYKELEEERNASDIAANQAMAMINKLQEEKATMQLEVMQYLRMMEEQTEYEQEALRKLNDQLTEREKEIQDLEAELESCRNQSRDESIRDKNLQPLFDSGESEYSTTSTPHVVRPRRRKKHHLPSVMFQDSEWPADPIKENLLDFEDEREYIFECLKRLEKNVRLFSSADASRLDGNDDAFSDEIYADDTDCVNLELQQDIAEGEGTKHNLCPQNIIGGDCGTQEISQKKEMISFEKPLSPHVEGIPPEANNISPMLEAEFPIGEDENNSRLNTCTNKLKSTRGKKNGGVALSDEVEHLNANY
ncbi:myosin-binding protein 1 isoform X2 [Phalaenopsis equestris]|uniref:myosin-binding protein 1 isoform X2 n=1 Tax=Phalaenopsis equestris TaxID=78828 RepID=UPI0009E3C514|nr:myosin-binding protein 1 isoform X2 [Phalaenopsis equestris]